MTTQPIQIVNTKIHKPMTIVPGATVELELQGNFDSGLYQVHVKPLGIYEEAQLIGNDVVEEKGNWRFQNPHHGQKPSNGLRISFKVPSHLQSVPPKIEVTIKKEVQPGKFEDVGTTTGDVTLIVPSGSNLRGQPVQVVRKESVPTNYTRSIVFHKKIEIGCERMSFKNYKRYMDFLLCNKRDPKLVEVLATDMLRTGNEISDRMFLPFSDTNAYRVLKMATEAFVLVMSESVAVSSITTDNQQILTEQMLRDSATSIGAVVRTPEGSLNEDYERNMLEDANGTLTIPYLHAIFDRLQDQGLSCTIFPGFQNGSFIGNGQGSCRSVLQSKLTDPIMIELIWSYWHEQAMQVQTMFAIRNRFQNISNNTEADPLASMEIGVLRPLNNLLWGYIQDEQHRLTLARRNYEYEHHYGLSLRGKAVPMVRPADRRSKFMEAFHSLLYICSVFFKEDDDTNRRADSFPVLNALKEVHFLLSEGAHNQFNDLPTTSRIEMLMEQWLLGRPEFQSFLPVRESVAYPEDWMGAVDSMKSLQGWTSTSVMFFNELARFGEMLLLSVRYGHWSTISDRDEAANWAKLWRSQIQGYIQAYRVVTGVDLSSEPTGVHAEMRRRDPSLLILERWEEQKRTGLARPSTIRIAASPTAGTWAQPRLPGKTV
jgi:hypothetical protein